MKKLLRNYLLLSKYFLTHTLFFNPLINNAQVVNYVNNGSFESIYDCSPPFYPLSKARFWSSIDSIIFGGIYLSKCNGLVPINGSTYQNPKTGDGLIISTWYHNGNPRDYMKNRLKKNLQAGKVYCVKFHVNITNKSPYGMDGFGAY